MLSFKIQLNSAFNVIVYIHVCNINKIYMWLNMCVQVFVYICAHVFIHQKHLHTYG